MKQVATLAALAVAALAAVAGGSASTGVGGTTLKLADVQQSMAAVPPISDKTPPQVGGRLLFANALYNRAPQFGKPAGARIGRTEVTCTFVTMRAAQCVVTAHVPDGELVAMGTIVPGQKVQHFAITGGAGAYAGARGTVDSIAVNEQKDVATIHLLG